MTITELTPPQYDLEVVTFDLYRDIHKGIRAELFAVTSTAGSLDPSDHWGRAALADHVISVGRVLSSHAHHEDTVIDPILLEHLPALADGISRDHHELEARYDSLVELASETAEATTSPEQRRLGHRLYLGLSEFTSAYLIHQLVEERQVMPALEQAVGVDAVIGMHMEIISSIPPEEMAASLAFMLPAMNADDRAELLGGMRATAPAEAFAGVVSLAQSVLDPIEFAATAARAGLD